MLGYRVLLVSLSPPGLLSTLHEDVIRVSGFRVWGFGIRLSFLLSRSWSWLTLRRGGVPGNHRPGLRVGDLGSESSIHQMLLAMCLRLPESS